jgi:hypothetical protein
MAAIATTDRPAGGRTDGSAVQLGTAALRRRGDGTAAATAQTFIAEIVDGSTFDVRKPGPALPEPRADAAMIFSGGDSISSVASMPTESAGHRLVIGQDPDTGGSWIGRPSTCSLPRHAPGHRSWPRPTASSSSVARGRQADRHGLEVVVRPAGGSRSSRSTSR